MSIRGVITARHVLGHAGLIAREFGLGPFLRCFIAMVLRRPTTFLACITCGPRRLADPEA